LVGLALADGPDRPITRIARAKKRKTDIGRAELLSCQKIRFLSRII
jgi:hypothetical protein